MMYRMMMKFNGLKTATTIVDGHIPLSEDSPFSVNGLHSLRICANNFASAKTAKYSVAANNPCERDFQTFVIPLHNLKGPPSTII